MESTKIIESEQLILDIFSGVEKAKVELKVQNQMIKDAVNGDMTYHNLDLAAKDMKKQCLAVKNSILAHPSMVAVKAKVDELKEEIKEENQAVSQYLEKYVEETGNNLIPGKDGEFMKIQKTFRLVKEKKL